MATTDTRTGFRLPWSTDRAASREASAEPSDELAAAAPTADVDDRAATALEPGDMSPQNAAGDGVRGQEEEPVSILAPDAAPTFAQADPPAPASAPAARPVSVTPPTGAAPPRRPTKFLADLTRAMQAAAEQARTSTLEQFRADSTAVIEQIHARSATGATELRRHADDDVATIKDWSKAEIARIRDETERRVGSRREQLEGQLERHAAIVEHEVEKVRGRLVSFEAEMGQFFDDLVGEDDPAVFAARAASLPEAPSFEDLDDDAMTALLQEPGFGVPGSVVEDGVTSPEVETSVGAAEALEVVVAAEEAVGAPEVAVAAETAAEEAFGAVVAAEATLESAVVVDVVDEVPPDAENVTMESAPLEGEAAMAAIQAAAEAAAADPVEVVEPVVDEIPADATVAPTASDGQVDAPLEPELDPRLAMLGLTPDFAAAEVAAVEMAAAEIEDVPELGGDALAARLSGLVPGVGDAATETTVTTQVIVTGLVSVASIASFKRHMGRLPGVTHVGVSSGPDAEFVFAVSHDAATSLRDLIPTLPGFAARIAGTGDGVIQVSAQDPQD